MIKYIIAILALLALGLIAYVRLAPSDPKVWNSDPLTAKKPTTPNAFFMLPGAEKNPAHEFYMDGATLAQRFDEMAMSHPNVRRLAGGPDQLLTTYIARTPLMGYPDYISVHALDLGNNRSALAVFSRARFGISDRGVNKKRMLGWLQELAQGSE